MEINFGKAVNNTKIFNTEKNNRLRYGGIL